MKKTNLIISFESEKLDALTYYAEKKDIDLQSELADTLQKMYERFVPNSTRDYLEAKLERENVVKEKADKKKIIKEIIPNETDKY